VPESIRKVISLCARDECRWPLSLLGGTGAGKTCAALLLCDHVRHSEYMTHRQLMEQLLACDRGVATWSQDGISGTFTRASYYEYLGRAPLVVLDEIGTREKVTDHCYESLLRLLDLRATVPLILISNLSSDDLRIVFDDRIVSRLSAGTILSVVEPDQRRVAS
jgi:Cdc6-like AAA superfamily ATPase